MAIIGPKGIRLVGFESNESDAEIIKSPKTIIRSKKEGEEPHVIENPELPAKEFLISAKKDLEDELWGPDFAPVGEAFFDDLDLERPEIQKVVTSAHRIGNKTYPIVMHHEVLQSLPGIMLLHNLMDKYGEGNI